MMRSLPGLDPVLGPERLDIRLQESPEVFLSGLGPGLADLKGLDLHLDHITQEPPADTHTNFTITISTNLSKLHHYDKYKLIEMSSTSGPFSGPPSLSQERIHDVTANPLSHVSSPWKPSKTTTSPLPTFFFSPRIFFLWTYWVEFTNKDQVKTINLIWTMDKISAKQEWTSAWACDESHTLSRVNRPVY